MKKAKKQGSSMLLVIAIFGILSIVGTAALAATTASFRLRIDESHRIKNLYGAESGVDMAYIKMSEVVQSAINYGITEVNGTQKQLSVDEESDLFKANYMKYINENLVSEVGDKTYTTSSGEAYIKCNLQNKEGATINTINGVYVGDKTVTLESRYIGENEKKRVVSVTYTLGVPDNYKVESSTGERVSSLVKYSLVADQNLEISDTKNFNINGAIWVQGTMAKGDRKGNTVSFEEKYSGGIDVLDSSVNFAGNVNTASNFNVNRSTLSFMNNKVETPLASDIYAENIFLGNILNSNEYSNIIFNANKSNMSLANDLVIGSNDAQVDVNNFYGFNDITTENNNTSFSDNNVSVRGSSSIIINSDIWPSQSTQIGHLKVENEAYIMGSAYIKTEKPYQTGESVAVKGNYKAYTKPLLGEYDITQYEYIDPLVLLTKDANGEPLKLQDKVNHFVKAYDDKVVLRTAGVSLPRNNTYTVGAFISDNKVNANKLSVEQQSQNAVEYKEKYVDAVYFMSDRIEGADIENSFLKGEAQRTVVSEINWSGVETLIDKKGNCIELDGITLVLNDDVNSKVYIVDNTIKLNNRYITNIEEDSDRRYIIITTGEVNYSSDANLNGTIITQNNILIENSKGSIGMIPLTESELTEGGNNGILDLIFTLGDRKQESIIVNSQSVIEKEKWRIVK